MWITLFQNHWDIFWNIKASPNLFIAEVKVLVHDHSMG